MSADISSVIDHARKLAGPAPAADAELLQRFLDSRDEAAFAELVARHGPMVLGVCRRALGGADAEDACQAVFLALARGARAIRRRGSLAAWLHGVAGRVCARARSRPAPAPAGP